GNPHGMADRATTKLEDYVLTEVVNELVGLPRVDAAGCDGHHAGHRSPVLVEVDPVHEIALDIPGTEGVVVAPHHIRIAFELADHRSRVDVVNPEEPAPLRDHP